MVMEAHQLIALSIRKIAASRGQRGGVNLHKNLLVASVLFKARHVFLAEGNTFGAVQSYETQAEEPLQVNSSPMNDCEADDEQEDVPHCDVQSEESAESHDNVSYCQESVVAEHSECQDSMEVTNTEMDFDKENSPPPPVTTRVDVTVTMNVVPETCENEQLSSCAKCTTKRRLTEDGENNTSHYKRARTYQNEGVTQQQAEDTQRHVACNTGPECTQRVQMNSLVHRFNTGLTGFLSSARDHVVQDHHKSTEKDSHGLCSNNVTSCSTQIKEAFETLSRPVLALAV